MTVRTVSRPELLDGDGSDTTFRGMVYDLLAVGARMQEVRDRLAREMGVTGPQYAILMAIFHLQEEFSGPGVRAVARRLHVSGPFVTAQSRFLVNEGLVEKKPNPLDGRGVWLCLTEEGSRRIAHTAELSQKANDAFFGSLDSVHFLVLSDIATRLEKSSDRAVRALNERTKPV
ncbi:MAG: MarR family winged helix-turn-helix transcriptional regulator [Alphaproteobacteria bacterium]|jgi:DNA-binding MarR family transcriptional regulator|nr:MarR family winged helix-turn-helix transcriptional regulator [Alphaproteobacteria bacterium]